MKRSYRFIRCTAAAVTAAVMFSGPYASPLFAQDAITPAKNDGMTAQPEAKTETTPWTIAKRALVISASLLIMKRK